ncbi:MAG: hypothetical protein KF744_17350 [Taibaiella sp.]|nr:hypothetical protein [Taibaiella sp.]
MKNTLLSLGISLLAACLTGCQSYSKYTIDEKPIVKLDNNLLGIWKAVEDTNRYDYILIQNRRDVYEDLVQTVSGFRNDSEASKRWSRERVRESITSDYKSYCDDKYKEQKFYISRIDHGGHNPHYERWGCFMSKVGASTFLNIPYHYYPDEGDGQEAGEAQSGFFFLRILRISEGGNLITIAAVKDPALRYLESSGEVRARISSKMQLPSYYSDTLHFYKVSDYHASIEGSVEVANKWSDKK